MYSVVIPAHNEENVISRCLSRLFEHPVSKELDVIVICNGCKDATADVARQFSGVRVIEIETASKIAALNAADQACVQYPVAYLDADVEVSALDLIEASRYLVDNSDIKVASPSLRVNYSNSSYAVKSFYRVWTKLPYFSEGQMIGSGLYILSRQGKERLGKFPRVISDDGYVRSLFKPHERITIPSCHFTIHAPQNLRSLIGIKTRARFGNMEVKSKFPNTEIGGDNKFSDVLKLFFSRPSLLPAIVIYVYIQMATKVHSRKRMKVADFSTWERDESSRGA